MLGVGFGEAAEEGIADRGGEGGVPGERLKDVGSGSDEGAASAGLAGAKSRRSLLVLIRSGVRMLILSVILLKKSALGEVTTRLMEGT